MHASTTPEHSSSPVRRLLQVLLTAACLNLTAPLWASEAPATPASVAQAPMAGDEQPRLAETMPHDLSPWGMYQQADRVVRAVMISLVLASVLTWTIWLAKSLELVSARRRLRRDLQALRQAGSLAATERLQAHAEAVRQMLDETRDELQLSAAAADREGIKNRISFRLERLVAASSRQISQGTGVLASIGSVAPFVGLFGTVWGIMNSFIGIAKAQTSNLAVVAPGIAEALLATALGLVAAIPAVLIYNLFARAIGGYKAQVTDSAAQILLLASRDLDLPASAPAPLSMARAV